MAKSNVTSLLALARKREIGFEIPTEDGSLELFGNLSMQVIDKIEEMRKQSQLSILGGDLSFSELIGDDVDLDNFENMSAEEEEQIKLNMRKNIVSGMQFNLAEATKLDTNAISEIVQMFFGDKYEVFKLNMEQHGLAYAEKNVFEKLEECISEEIEKEKGSDSEGKN